MSGFRRALEPAEIAAIDDSRLDFGDIPELDERFRREAGLVVPDHTEQITLRVKLSGFNHSRAPGRGYQTRMNRVLESYVRAQRKTGYHPRAVPPSVGGACGMRCTPCRFNPCHSEGACPGSRVRLRPRVLVAPAGCGSPATP